MDEYARFRDELIEAGHLVPMGVEGIFGKGADFETIVEGVNRCAGEAGRDLGSTPLAFPPLLPRSTLERTDYLRSFPNLIGAVHAFSGGDREHRALLALLESGGEWAAELDPTDLALCTATCHPIYPMAAGQLPKGGRRYNVFGWNFRHEPSVDPARMQAFRQREFVYLGDPDSAEQFRDMWIERGLAVLRSLGLPAEAVVANDPFFGRSGRLLAAGQREEALKYELVVPICSTEKPTAIASSNAHRDHFGVPFGITTADGHTAHSACVGFGMERITLALLHTHGLDVSRWPASVRTRLWG
jgi:seryl-tRNA synthetase